jgi:RND family efflux transporter MFP subunit
MAPEPLNRLIRALHPLAGPDAAGLSDARLVERFVATRDEAAFELLLWRHGPTVLGVCRRTLRHPHDAEDAFQATFLTLARKAGALARAEAVGSWLYRVAYRVALRVRADRARRAEREQEELEVLAAPVAAEPDGGLRAVLDEEVDRLPSRQRAAFVLCCLEGKTGEEAARQLGCPAGTVSSRLTRARERLRRRLARRGLAPAALAALLSAQAGAAPLPAPLVGATLKAGLAFAAGKAPADAPPRAVAYAEGVLRAMFLTRLKLVSLLVLVASVLAAGGALTHRAPAAQENKAPPAAPDETAPQPAIVRVVKPLPGGLKRTVQQPCTVQAFAVADLYPSVSGALKSLTVDIGDRVKKGQVLAQIDAPLLTLTEKEAVVAVQQARGKSLEAQARLATAKAELTGARSTVEAREGELKAIVSQKEEYKRRAAYMKPLMPAISKDEYMATIAAYERSVFQTAAATGALARAKADVDVQHSKIAEAEASLLVSKANDQAAEVALEKARHMLGLTRITAPFDGVITQANFRPGEALRADGKQPLLTVQRIDRIRVVTQVKDNDAPLTEPGDPAELSFDALPGVRLTGASSRVGFALDPTHHTMRVEIDLPNLRGQFRPGMSGTAILQLRKTWPGALRLPRSALTNVVTATGQRSVYVIRGGKAHLVFVTVGTSTAKEVEVLDGLKPDDQVVADQKGLSGNVVPVKVEE